MICILGAWFFGLGISGGHAAYINSNPEDTRWSFVAQLPVGAPAFPALIQALVTRDGKPPLFGGFMAAPRDLDELGEWHLEYDHAIELGIVYTMVAGLLNILAIYDAFAGPAEAGKDEADDEAEPEEDDSPADAESGGDS